MVAGKFGSFADHMLRGKCGMFTACAGLPPGAQRKSCSKTETFVGALKPFLDRNNWRWAGVPFYLRTGKASAQH